MKMMTWLAALCLGGAAALAWAQPNPAPARQVARIMGDIVQAQTTPDAEARTRIEAQLSVLEALLDKTAARGDLASWRMLDALSRALLLLDASPVLAPAAMQRLVDDYEAYFAQQAARARRDAGFLVLDLRFRYLAQTLAPPSAGAGGPRLQTPLDQARQQAEVALRPMLARRDDARLTRDWAFLNGLLARHASHPAPRILDQVALRLYERHLL